MTDSDLTDVVMEHAREQVDVQELLSGGSVAEQIDSGELGAAVGASVGESLGRAFGRSIGREVHSALNESLSNDVNRGEFIDSLKSSMRTGIRNVSVEDSGASSIVATVRDVLVGEDEVEDGEDEEVVDDEGEGEAEDVEDEEVVDDESEDVDEDEAADDEESDERAGDDGEEKVEDVTDDTDTEEPDSSEVDADDLDPSDVEITDLEELRTDTLEAYLETISYRELQSIAKDVDVTANLKREEMTDRIVDTVAGESAS